MCLSFGDPLNHHDLRLLAMALDFHHGTICNFIPQKEWEKEGEKCSELNVTENLLMDVVCVYDNHKGINFILTYCNTFGMYFWVSKLKKLLTWLLGQAIHRCYYMSIPVFSPPLRQQCCQVQREVVVVVWERLNCNIADEHHRPFLVLSLYTQIVHYHDYTMHLLSSNHKFLFLADNRLC